MLKLFDLNGDEIKVSEDDYQKDLFPSLNEI